jgi:thioredoxin 1|tara:strand:- start:217 stop:528 length:312 start_codon:yes stop_codon:yes gene_type:complete
MKRKIIKDQIKINKNMEIPKKGKVLLQFTADWCGPCRAMKSVTEEFQSKSDVTFQKVNVDTESSIAQKYGVRSIPCFVVVEDDKEKIRKVGSQSLSQLLDLVK